MPDKIIDIPGVGPVAFPESLTEPQMNAAATKVYQDANPGKKQPPVKSWTDTAVDWIPAVAGAAGGIIGGIGGTAFGMGVGGAPGAIGGAALGGAAGEATKQLVNQARGAPAPTSHGDAAASIGAQAAIQGGAEATGVGVGKAMSAVAPWVMQSAVKPTISMLKEYGTTAPKLVQTLFDEGINVTEGGLAKLQKLFEATNDQIRAAVQGASGQIDKKVVAARALPTAQKIAQQVNPTRDLQAVGDTVQEFLDHPVYTGNTLSVPEAQAMKVGTYQQIGKKYGEVSSAAIETQKALARGLKEEIAAEVPGIAGLNTKDSELMAALDAVGRRVALSGNKDPIGFAWVAAHPTTFIAALFDRSPAVKSMLARGLYQGAGAAAKVSPQLIRVAVTALSTAAPGDEPAPASGDSSARPGSQ